MTVNTRQSTRPSARNPPSRLPTGERSAAARLASFLTSDRRRGSLQMVDPSGRVMDVPPTMTTVIRRAAELMAAGQAVTVLADDAFLTTQQAATLLNVSRQYLVRLIEAGQAPAIKVGAHRRLRAADVQALKVRRDVQRTAALDTLTSLSEEVGGYDLPSGAR